jgi:hypothetical protein
MIENLPQLSPDAARAARTLERCHERLARHRHQQAQVEQHAGRHFIYERVFVAGLCVVHLIAVAGDILRMRGSS